MMVTRRQLPARGRGSSATAIRGNNFAEGIFYGLARFARAEPVDSDEHARSTGTLRDLHQRPVRRSVRQRAARSMVADVVVCWWRSDDARGAEHRRRRAGDNATLGAKRRHRCRRRMMAAGYAGVFWCPESGVGSGGTEPSAENASRSPILSALTRAREGRGGDDGDEAPAAGAR